MVCALELGLLSDSTAKVVSKGPFVEHPTSSPSARRSGAPYSRTTKLPSPRSHLQHEANLLECSIREDSCDSTKESVCLTEERDSPDDADKLQEDRESTSTSSTCERERTNSTSESNSIDASSVLPIESSEEKDDVSVVSLLPAVEATDGSEEDEEDTPSPKKLSRNFPKRKRSRVKRMRRHRKKSEEVKETYANFYTLCRVTRSFTKSAERNFVGRLVWGYCSGWWPALVITAEDVGNIEEPGKLWVYWMGESLISHLNEKTQISPFLDNLESRIKQKLNWKGKRSVHSAIKMLHERRGGVLTKPYHLWIEKNFFEENGCEASFYPYPDDIKKRLDLLKEKNAKITEKYVSEQKQPSEQTKKQQQQTEKPNGALRSNNGAVLHLLPLMQQQAGMITWAKMAGQNWWPAMIIDYRDCCMREPSFGCQWVMWYGDYTLSEVNHRFFMKFREGMSKMEDYTLHTKKHPYLLGVLDASKDYGSRLGHNTSEWVLADALKFFSTFAFREEEEEEDLKPKRSPKLSEKYSNLIVEKLNQSRINTSIDDQRKKDITNSDALRSVMSGKSSMETLCLRCLRAPRERMEQHPFLKGSLCKNCSELLKPRIFVIGDDGKCYYCTVCAGSGIVVVCDNDDCPRVYCTACLKYLIYPDVYDDVLLQDPWKCFLCDKNSVTTKGIIHPRADWKEKLASIFRTNQNSNVANIDRKDIAKRKMRVLSLFDGLSAGLLVFMKLGISVEVYYASEIDEDALTVSSSHFGDRIIYLGDVRNITKEKIEEIAPIDLLIGGSPCNDLSLVNPARLGLHDPNGTGVLFFEYTRIMKLLKKANKDRELLWLFENVASMPSEYRLEINRHLGQEPDVIDAADFSPQHRLRLYWHNLPVDVTSLSSENHDQIVQDVLTPHLSRYALVKKLRTVTTKSHSLKQGKMALKPILMKNECDSIWITELEEIFGFPRHYTDVKNLPATKRQRLVGKSWSVQTLTAIFRPLRSLFECS